MFKNPFSFDGRIRRTEYALTFVVYTVIIMFISFTSISIGENGNVLFLVFIPLIWMVWAQGAKRCHDLGNSGWYQLIPFYPLWMMFQQGQVGENRYGRDPQDRYLEAADELLDDEYV